MSAVERPLRVAVIGAAAASDVDCRAARAVGAALAKAGAVVVCGGRGGVMEAAARGAAEGGGLTIGLLPGAHASEANAWIRVPIPTGMGEGRNILVVRSAEAVLAVGGEWGTLSEIALARKIGLDVGVLGRPPAEGLGLPRFADAEEAVGWALDRARVRRTASGVVERG